jgi:plasmid maintenance system antidote protein VapI
METLSNVHSGEILLEEFIKTMGLSQTQPPKLSVHHLAASMTTVRSDCAELPLLTLSCPL